jgi:hypothetical protein
MNPTSQSKGNGTVSIKLGGMNFERQLSEKEAEFLQDVVETALRNYAQARLQNRVDQLQSETPEETQGPRERITKQAHRRACLPKGREQPVARDTPFHMSLESNSLGTISG